MGTCNAKGGFRCGWVHDGSGLIEGLVHSGFQGTRQIGSLPKVGTMRDSPHAHLPPVDKSETYPITCQPSRQRRDERRCRRLDTWVFKEGCHAFQYSLRVPLCCGLQCLPAVEKTVRARQNPTAIAA